MEAIDYLREEIKSHFTESYELQLSSYFALHRRFNFYFKITDHYPYLLYLNWDGEGNHFTLKCLEFDGAEILDTLIGEYPDKGAKSFNIGKPKLMVDFIYRDLEKLYVTDCKGIQEEIRSKEITRKKLMECVDPGK
ncbi:hypothetical protein L0657_00395 [Dyadobacter sp. CY345]|uniref:hypothetical protein n=1 Tax=Dyadobacter sp. CY345 TaxID=2909335 RepID=UPI001F1C9C88|nr:hypothetical protein [Dyadobacter sp. CY345]MCF2442393.1 hypothetical protein [Dyadobacter sp. CY345]